MESLLFNKSCFERTVKINSEAPFFKLIDSAFIRKFEGNPLHEISMNLSLLGEKRKELRPPQDLIIDINQDMDIIILKEGIEIVNSNIPQAKEILIKFEKEAIGDNELEIFYESQNLDVSMESPWEEFKKHLNEPNNAKILFSAPFGQGKTTFLKEFFKKENEKKEQYEVFHLFPVNYAVASNEDIFRLVKTEILVKLLENPTVEFIKESFSYLQTLPHFALKNAHKILSPFLKALPVVGESVFGIYEKLEDLTRQYFSENDRLQIEDRKTAQQYIQEAYEDEGSIFEDNFYSQLIRELIGQLKEKGRKTVLIIDDTDRMDPEHIFRILNVFAAHFDAPEYRSGDSNKFGFDKIIIVCDYDNLHKIFCHKYGATTDFAGYIDKFFSKQIFRYDNINSILKYIRTIVPEQYRNRIRHLEIILSDLIRTHLISLREILRIKGNDPLYKLELFSTRYYNQNIASPILIPIYILYHIFNTEILKNRIQRCKNYITNNQESYHNLVDYNRNVRELIVHLILFENIIESGRMMLPDEKYKLPFEDDKLELEFSLRNNDIDIIFSKGEVKNIVFSAHDYYELTLIAIEKYEKLITEK